MKRFFPLGIFSILLQIAFLAGSLTAEDKGARQRYKLVDLGTLGGPISYGSASGDGARLLNDSGEVSSYADTALPDPFAPDLCFDADCLLAHTFRWRNGKIIDLGGLDDTLNSPGDSINDRGWVTGFAQTGLTDPSFQNQRGTLLLYWR